MIAHASMIMRAAAALNVWSRLCIGWAMYYVNIRSLQSTVKYDADKSKQKAKHVLGLGWEFTVTESNVFDFYIPVLSICSPTC